MRLGCFGTVGDIEAVARSGFDFIELNLRELIELTDAQFASVCARLSAAGLGADACSWIMPVELDLTAPTTRFADWRGYLETGASRSAALGAALWPLGSGKGRGVKPENGPEAAQNARFADFIARLAEIANAAGVSVAVEPLGPAYSNFLGKIEEAAAFAESLNMPNVGTMCDLRHMTASGDPLGEIERWGDRILHAHIDLPAGDRRLFPRRSDGWDYTDYIRRIQITRAARLSVEALHEADLAAGADSVAYLRALLAETAQTDAPCSGAAQGGEAKEDCRRSADPREARA